MIGLKLFFHTCLLLKLISFRISANVTGKVFTTLGLGDSKQAITTVEKSENLSVVLEGSKSFLSFPNHHMEFQFFNIPDGIYTIYVNDVHYDYESYLVDVNGEDVNVYQRNLKSGRGFKTKFPIQLKPLEKIKYEEESQNVVGSILKSPYMLVIGMTVLMFLCMQMVPQDQLQEQFKQMNKQMHQYQKGNFNQEPTTTSSIK